MNLLKNSRLFVIAGLLFFCSNSIAQDKVVSWDFPIKPGTDKWNQLNNETERFNALQIPDAILDQMETEQLVIVCLNYPSAFHYTAYNDEHYGLQKVISNFNGLQELFKRNDAGRYLIEHYINADEYGFIIKDVRLDERYWSLRFTYMELLLSQKEIIQNLEAEDKLILLETTLNKLDLKAQNKETFSKYNNIVSALIVVRIMESDNVEKVLSSIAYRTFATNRKLPDYKTVEEVLELGKTYIERLKPL